MNVFWKVVFTKRSLKQKGRLPKGIQIITETLAGEIEKLGPYRNEWPNYSKLNRKKGIPENAYHCHLKKGNPHYVACWRIEDKNKKMVEIYYVGTHENAPY